MAEFTVANGYLAARITDTRERAFAAISELGGYITVIKANADEWLIKACPPKREVWAANGSRSFVTTIAANGVDDDRMLTEWSRVLRVISTGTELQRKIYPRLRIFKHEGGDWATAIKYAPKVEGASYAFSSSHADAIGYASDRIKGGYPHFKITAQVQG